MFDTIHVTFKYYSIMSKTANIIESKRFVMRKNLVGKNATVRVIFKSGKKAEYDHDAVYEANKEMLEAMPCFQKYKTYTATNSVPSWAKEFAS